MKPKLMHRTTSSVYLSKRVRDIIAHADRLEEAGDLSGAIAELSRAIELDPESPILRSRRGLVLSFAEDWGSAIQDFHVALESRPDVAYTRFLRAVARLKLEDLDGALRDFEEVIRRCHELAVRKKERLADTYFETGRIHQRRGDLERALTAYESAGRAVESGYLDVGERVTEIREQLESPG